MDAARHLTLLQADAARIAEVAATGSTAPVPGCPDWDVPALVRHVGRIHRWVTMILTTRPDERPKLPKVDDAPASGDELAAWSRAESGALVDALRATAADDLVWNWAANAARPATFWFRRMAQETAVHRWDAEAALGEPRPIDPELAVDGIDELFDIWFVDRVAGVRTGSGETVHLHATDAEGEWLVRLGEDGTTVTREHAKGDVAARGAASDLLLLLWNRTDPSTVDVFGDVELLQRFCSSLKV